MTTKNRILAMERRRQGGRRLKTRFPGLGNEEFCMMIAAPITGASDTELWAIVQTGCVEDFAGTYFPKAGQ